MGWEENRSALILTEREWLDLDSILRLTLAQCIGLVHDEKELISRILEVSGTDE